MGANAGVPFVTGADPWGAAGTAGTDSGAVGTETTWKVCFLSGVTADAAGIGTAATGATTGAIGEGAADFCCTFSVATGAAGEAGAVMTGFAELAVTGTTGASGAGSGFSGAFSTRIFFS